MRVAAPHGCTRRCVMRTVRFLFAGLIFSSVIFAQQGDPGAAERFRMKFGRSTAAEQSTGKPSDEQQSSSGESRRLRGEIRPNARTHVDSPERMDSATCDCCHHKQ